MNENNVLDLSELERPLREKLEGVEAEEAKLRAELDEITNGYRDKIAIVAQHRRQLEKTLNMLTTGRATPATKGRPSNVKVSEELQQEIVDAIRAHGNNATVPELLHAGLRRSQNTVNKALLVMREREVVRRAGKRKSAHDDRPHGANATAWAVMDNG